MSDKKTIQSINTDPSAPDAKTVHNFGEAMGQIAQAHQATLGSARVQAPTKPVSFLW
jgi:hypothetical protein